MASIEMVRAKSRVVRPPPMPARDAGASELDEPHRAIWQAIRHLFPAHAMVDQTDYGCMLVSWLLVSVRRDGRRCRHFAAPVVIRLQPGLMLALWTCDPAERDEIAHEQVPVVREHLAGYDPHARVPTCGVIVLGE
jgi:hypothetical protein